MAVDWQDFVRRRIEFWDMARPTTSPLALAFRASYPSQPSTPVVEALLGPRRDFPTYPPGQSAPAVGCSKNQLAMPAFSAEYLL